MDTGEQVAAALASAGIGLDDISGLSEVAGEFRNRAWTFRERSTGTQLVLKIQSEVANPETVAAEAEVLRELSGRYNGVPTLRYSGREGVGGLPFLITERLPGRPLAEWVSEGAVLDEGLLGAAAQWLHGFSTIDVLDEVLLCRASDYVGTWEPDYTPPGAPSMVVAADTGTAGEGPHRIGLVHGSFDPGNILIQQKETPAFVGAVDFEATRLGSPLIDVSSLAVHLLIVDLCEVALSWLAIAAEVWDWPGLAGAALPYIIAQHQRRMDAAERDSEVGLASPETFSRFLARAGT